MRCLIVEDWFFSAILWIIFHTVVVLVDKFNWFTKCCQLIFLTNLIVFQAFALSNLNESRLLVEGLLLNLQRAALRSQIAILHSLLNQGVLCLFDGEVFGMVSFAIVISVCVKCFNGAEHFEWWTSLVLHNVLNCCQSTLFVFQQGDLLLSLIGGVISIIMVEMVKDRHEPSTYNQCSWKDQIDMLIAE